GAGSLSNITSPNLMFFTSKPSLSNSFCTTIIQRLQTMFFILILAFCIINPTCLLFVQNWLLRFGSQYQKFRPCVFLRFQKFYNPPTLRVEYASHTVRFVEKYFASS